MHRKFITNLILLLSLNLLIKPFWILGIDRSVQNMVGLEDYGFYSVIFNFSFLFNILLDLGITNFNTRNIAQNKQLLNKHFSGIISIRFLLALLYVSVTFIAALALGYRGEQLYLLGWIAFNQFLLSSILYLRSNISGLLMLRTDSLISVLDRSLMIIFCAILLWGNVTSQPFRIEWFVYAQTAAYLLTALIALSIVVVKAKFKKIYWNWPFFVMIVKRSLPFATLVLMMSFYNRIDPVLIERLLPYPEGDIQAGVYAQAFRLFDAANQIAYLFAVLLLPIFSHLIKQGKEIVSMVKLAFSLLFAVSVSVAVTSFFYASDLMHLLYPEKNIENSSLIFSILMFGFIAVSGIYVFGTLLTANGSLKQLNIIAAFAIIFNLTVNIILIPKIQAVGSAYASLSAQFISVILQVIVVQRIFKFRINLRYLASLALFAALVVLGAWFSRQLHYSWWINAAMVLAYSFILASLLRLFNIRGLIAMVRERESEPPE
ncbi:MAG: oligosaccharide flippase family protein [Bacteroidales bacterium]|jgi:O-antigen/teichoic acid export membrane protein|nr:oligosaccharide flippase family protein [Bacteroidales bacterium]